MNRYNKELFYYLYVFSKVNFILIFLKKKIFVYIFYILINILVLMKELDIVIMKYLVKVFYYYLYIL